MATGTLTSTTIAARYKSLLKLTGTANDVLAADASAKYVEDGDGNDSVLSLSTTRIGIGNTAPDSLLEIEQGSSGGLVAFKVDNNDTDKVAVSIEAANIDADVMDISADAVTTANVIDITADALTTGSAAIFATTSTALATTVSGGLVEILSTGDTDTNVNNLLFVKNDHADSANTIGIYVQQDSTEPAISATGGIVEQGGVLKENLLVNSGFDVWSNGVLREAVGGAAPVISGANSALTNTLVTNGGFDSATTSWSATNASLSSAAGGQTGNCLTITRSSGSAQIAAQGSITTVVGKLYQFGFYVKSGTSTNEAYIFRIWDGSAYIVEKTGTSSGDWVSVTGVVEATATSLTIEVYKNSATAGTMLFDTITLYEVIPGSDTNAQVGCDGWLKATTHSDFDIWRNDYIDAGHASNTTNSYDGSYYSLKMQYDRASQPLYGYFYQGGGTDEFTQRFAGRTVTLGCWVKSPVASKAGIGLDDNANSFAGEGDEVLTSGTGWEWLEITKTFSTSISGAWFYLRVVGHAGSVSGNHIGYYSQPMLVFGSSIGEGNYTRPPGEVIYLEAEVSDEMGTFSDTSITTRNLEAVTSGKIPKGAKAVQCTVTCRDSGSLGELTNCYIFLTGNSASEGSIALRLNGIANDAFSAMSGWVGCTSDGDIKYTIQATGSSTFDVAHNRFFAVQLR